MQRHFLIILLWALGLSAPALAVTPTFTPTDTPVPTATPTPGEGFWSYALPTPMILGFNGYSGTISYEAGASAWPSTGGILRFIFPQGISAPSTSNFYVQGSQQAQVLGYINNGAQVDVQVRNLAPGGMLTFYYGFNSSAGFMVSTTTSPLVLSVLAYPQSLTLGAGGAVAQAPSLSPVIIVTATATPTVTMSSTASPTFTITETHTISPTFSESPTFTVSPTFTITPTFTPIGPERAGVYCYPDPFDIRIHRLVTFRYPADTMAQASVFNLAGNPVVTIPDSEINPSQGWARWRGDDDRGLPVAGGMYFVRIKTPKGTHIHKFIVFR